MAERKINVIPLNCKALVTPLSATFPDGVYECTVNCPGYVLRESMEFKLKTFPAGIAQLNPVNQGSGTVCRTETCDNQGGVGFS